MIRTSAFISAALALSLLMPLTASAGEAGGMSVKGYLATKYVSRTSTFAGEKFYDQDFLEYARLDLTAGKDEMFEVHFFGSSRQDSDGGKGRFDFTPYDDAGNAGTNAYRNYVYDAHLAVNNPISHLRQLRLGRQYGTRDDGALFDGLAADLALGRMFGASLYAGNAVHQDEILSDYGKDKLAGAALDFMPDFDTLVSLDYMYAKDMREYLELTDQTDDVWTLKVWRRITDNVRAMARVRSQDGETRDLKISGLGSFSQSGFSLSASYYRQLEDQLEQTTEFSSYYDIVGTTYEYQSIDLKARKLIGESLAVDIGYFRRAMMENDDEGAFNRDYSRTYASLDLMDAIMKSLTLSLTAERWKANVDSSWSGGLDASYDFRRLDRRARMSAGTYYSLYKYDNYQEQGERVDVQSYYMRATIPVAPMFTADAKYEYEDGAENYHTLSVGVRYDF